MYVSETHKISPEMSRVFSKIESAQIFFITLLSATALGLNVVSRRLVFWSKMSSLMSMVAV